jgi:hypothetical protein
MVNRIKDKLLKNKWMWVSNVEKYIYCNSYDSYTYVHTHTHTHTHIYIYIYIYIYIHVYNPTNLFEFQFNQEYLRKN